MGKREYHEIISIMKDNRFWIYGYGKVAKRLYRQAIRRGFGDKLAGFIVTDLRGINERFCKKPIISIDKFDKDDWVIIAADTTSTKEIGHSLTKHGVANYYEGFFSMVDLEVGLPIESEKMFSAKRFFVDSPSSMWVAAIYLAATSYLNEGLSGKDIYIKFSSNWLGIETAKKDYHRFMDIVAISKKNGFIQDFPIKICKDLYILDGAHRIVLSECFGDGVVVADVYDINQEEWEKIILQRTLALDDDKILLNFLTEDELKLLKGVSQTMH